MENQNHNKKKQERLPMTEMGRIQPQARELEKAVLGAVMLEKEAFQSIDGFLSEDDFYDPVHQTIFKAVSNLGLRSEPIDMLTVSQELRKMGELESVGGPVYVSDLTGNIGSAANIEHHARIIKQMSIARQIISATSAIQQMAFDDTIDVSETLEEFEKKCTEIVISSTGESTITINEAIKNTLDKASEVQKLKQQGLDISITTGLKGLDDAFLGGWRSPDLIVVGARPSMGKTQLALSFSKAAFNAGRHVLFISIEMSANQLISRYLLEDESISNYNLKTGQMSQHEWEALDRQASMFYNRNLTIVDKPSITVSEIKSIARKQKRKQKLDLLVIDYLGLIGTSARFERRDLEIGFITRSLKSLCKELDIPTILLAQLNRPPKGLSDEAKAVKEPDLEDLRESGNIEQDADKVCFIHRPAYYKEDISDSKGESWQNRGKILIAKDRDGIRNHSVIFHHDDRFKRISDYPIHHSTQFPTATTRGTASEGTPF
ncbi:replicative DNA helicase [Dysgonomonas sp. 521]|uniref:replicative DNA helicase n=1 Tax=Dysgonomonas sp. 521 TaxID=2302932 RepID=UPI0013D070DA|nr:replicative DNA helicase [Dysgonomonas sp. 521]NDV93496.1 replicative DNA helicase [Dysgonomonas sp. 521]